MTELPWSEYTFFVSSDEEVPSEVVCTRCLCKIPKRSTVIEVHQTSMDEVLAAMLDHERKHHQ